MCIEPEAGAGCGRTRIPGMLLIPSQSLLFLNKKSRFCAKSNLVCTGRYENLVADSRCFTDRNGLIGERYVTNVQMMTGRELAFSSLPFLSENVACITLAEKAK
jgi:hypothetical protein